MDITIAEILFLKSFNGCKVIAGTRGLQRVIDQFTVLEITDIMRQAPQNCLVLSTLFPILNNEAQSQDVIKKFSAYGVNGIAIKLNKQGEKVPEKMLEDADRHGIPIIILPDGGNFSYQINDFLNHRLGKNLEQLRVRDALHNLLFKMILDRQGYDSLRNAMSEHLHYDVAFYDKNMNLIHTAKQPKSPKVLQFPEKIGPLSRKETSKDNFRYIDEDVFKCLYALHDNLESIGYFLLMRDAPFELSVFEKMTVEQFASVFAIIYHRNHAHSEIEKRYKDEFIFDLILEKIIKESDAFSRAERLRWRLEYPVQMIGINLPARMRRLFQLDAENIESSLYNHLSIEQSNILLGNFEDNLILLLNKSNTETMVKIADMIDQLLKKRKIGKYNIGISQTIPSVQRFPKAYDEVKTALALSKSMNENAPVFYENLGIYRVLDTFANKKEVASYCNEVLGPIFLYDQQNDSNLFETLQAVLRHEGNLKKASQSLFIHYNTIRYRFKKIEELLQKELRSLSAYQEIFLAVKMYERLVS